MFVLYFFPSGWPVTQLGALMLIEVFMLAIIYCCNACDRPIFINGGEQSLVTVGSYIQLMFYVLPAYSMTQYGTPSVSLMLYVTALAIIFQILAVALKAYLIIKGILKKKKADEVERNDHDIFMLNRHQGGSGKPDAVVLS